jgi:hypothetical protein
MDRMRTPLLTSLILLASSAAAFAQTNNPSSEPAGTAPAEQPVPPAAAPVPAPPVPPPAPPAATTTVVRGAGGPAPVVVETPPAEPASITEVGLQRLPAYAYPEWQTRGLKHGSLWLTFHGMQWPYMPSFTNGQRFVIGISGWGWIDNSYEKFGPWGNSNSVDANRIKYWKQQARMLLRVTPTYALDRDYFIQAQVELVGTGDQLALRSDVGGADTDDLYLRVGKWRSWDFQVGRFEGWEIFHLGMGLDFNTFERIGAVGPGDSTYTISYYGVSDNQFRPAGAAGNVAFHYYPLPYLRFELLGMAGSSLIGPQYAARPVAIFDIGWLKLKFGTEYQHIQGLGATDQTDITSKGIGGAIQFVFLPHVEFGLNGAQGTVVNIDGNGRLNPVGSFTRSSVGGFLNVSNGDPRHPLLFGLGSMVTWTEDQNGIAPNPVDKIWLYQGFVAVQYVIHNVFYVKLVGGYSRGHWSIGSFDPRIEYDNEVYSARLRFSFYF